MAESVDTVILVIGFSDRFACFDQNCCRLVIDGESGTGNIRDDSSSNMLSVDTSIKQFRADILSATNIVQCLFFIIKLKHSAQFLTTFLLKRLATYTFSFVLRVIKAISANPDLKDDRDFLDQQGHLV